MIPAWSWTAAGLRKREVTKIIELRHLEGLDYSGRDLLACEALLRRAAALHVPFVLKGSLLTRQYLQDPTARWVEDIDLLYMERLPNPEKAHSVFSHWMRQITETTAVEDGVRFRSFAENDFWRGIDYAMADDFPTVNTDLAYWFLAEDRPDYDELSLDISFQLDMPVAPIPLEYQPAVGEPFLVPFTVPLSVQVAWKLHQTIVRAREKDLQDLCLLLAHLDYSRKTLEETIRTLREECLHDKLRWPACAKPLFVGNMQDVYVQMCTRMYGKGAELAQKQRGLLDLLGRLRQCFDRAGINEETYRTF